jgi:hypothetical protein
MRAVLCWSNPKTGMSMIFLITRFEFHSFMQYCQMQKSSMLFGVQSKPFLKCCTVGPIAIPWAKHLLEGEKVFACKGCQEWRFVFCETTSQAE